MILSSVVYVDDPKITKWAIDLFTNAISPENLRADVRMTIYQAAIKKDPTLTTYEKLLRWYLETTIPGEQQSIAAALCGIDNLELMQRSLDLVSNNEVKLQDARFWIAYALRNRTQKQAAWEWLKHNWGWIGENYGQEKELDYFLRYSAAGFATDAHYKDYVSFFESNNIYGSERAFEQGKETIRWQTAWAIRDHDSITKWLIKFNM
jgi:aminopeptidase N